MIQVRKTLGLRAVVTALLLLACLCFGGSASVFLYEMGLSIFSLVCLLVVVWSGTSAKIVGPIRWFIAAFISLFAIQLMPLPDMIWSAMPQGRFAASLLPDSYLNGTWKSNSITPDATLYSLIAAAPALIVLWLMAGLNRCERQVIINVLISAVLCQALIGIAQVAGDFTFNIYNYQHPNVAIGLFASRNHFADLVLMGTSLTFLARQTWFKKYGRSVADTIFYGLLTLFLLAIIGSASRSGILIFVFIIILGFVIYTDQRNRHFHIISITIICAFFWMVWSLFPKTGVVKTAVARFSISDDARWDIWQNSWSTAQYYWPWGVGFGGFEKSYEQIEVVTSMKPHYVNSSHNEYLQAIIELGISFLFLGVVFICYFTRNIRAKVLDSNIILILPIAIHACFDYPFRVIGIQSVFCSILAIIYLRCDWAAKNEGNYPPPDLRGQAETARRMVR